MHFLRDRKSARGTNHSSAFSQCLLEPVSNTSGVETMLTWQHDDVVFLQTNGTSGIMMWWHILKIAGRLRVIRICKRRGTIGFDQPGQCKTSGSRGSTNDDIRPSVAVIIITVSVIRHSCIR